MCLKVTRLSDNEIMAGYLASPITRIEYGRLLLYFQLSYILIKPEPIMPLGHSQGFQKGFLNFNGRMSNEQVSGGTAPKTKKRNMHVYYIMKSYPISMNIST